jgi:FkbM family methyltransferase
MSDNTEYLREEQTIYDLLSDDVSRRIFNAIAAVRRTGAYESLPAKYPIEEQYFSKDIPLRKYSEFIDCGAYDGDTLDAMDSMNIAVNKIYAFEPDLQNFAKLADKVKKRNTPTALFPCGVYSSTQLLRFDAGSGESSKISETDTAATTIQAVALDDVLINTLSGRVMLKMDIEGAELDALKGAENMIRKNDIDLAICVYHKPQDIIEIPKLINTFGKYDFYLRLYGYYGMELVLYAIKQLT